MMWMAAVAYWLEGFRTRIDSLQPVVDSLKLAKRTAAVQRTPAPGAIPG